MNQQQNARLQLVERYRYPRVAPQSPPPLPHVFRPQKNPRRTAAVRAPLLPGQKEPHTGLAHTAGSVTKEPRALST